MILREKKSMTEAGRQAPRCDVGTASGGYIVYRDTAVTPSQDDLYEVNDGFVGLKVLAP